MDSEQLTMLLKALEGVGEDAKVVLIWWMVLPVISTMLAWCGGIVLAILLGRLIMAIFTLCRAPWEMAEALGVSIEPGFWIASDTRKVLSAIRKLQEKP